MNNKKKSKSESSSEYASGTEHQTSQGVQFEMGKKSQEQMQYGEKESSQGTRSLNVRVEPMELHGSTRGSSEASTLGAISAISESGSFNVRIGVNNIDDFMRNFQYIELRLDSSQGTLASGISGSSTSGRSHERAGGTRSYGEIGGTTGETTPTGLSSYRMASPFDSQGEKGQTTINPSRGELSMSSMNPQDEMGHRMSQRSSQGDTGQSLVGISGFGDQGNIGQRQGQQSSGEQASHGYTGEITTGLLREQGAVSGGEQGKTSRETSSSESGQAFGLRASSQKNVGQNWGQTGEITQSEQVSEKEH
ncbi:MAG: hypothetical protein ACM3SY_19130 [Candidatus Omnitrophota bacterium]